MGQVCLMPLVIGSSLMLGSFWLGNRLNSHLHNAVLPRDQDFHSAFSSLDCDVCMIRGQYWDVMLMLRFAKCSADILQGLCYHYHHINNLLYIQRAPLHSVSPFLIFRHSGNTQGLSPLKSCVPLGLGLTKVNGHLVLQLPSATRSGWWFF